MFLSYITFFTYDKSIIIFGSGSYKNRLRDGRQSTPIRDAL